MINELQTNPLTQGVHHVGLTVSNLHQCAAFFLDVLQFKKIAENSQYPSIFVSDGHTMITLWQVKDPSSFTKFDRKQNIGLHHLALSVKNNKILDEIYDLLLKHNIKIEFMPELNSNGTARHMICQIPGDIRIEFIAGIENK